MRLSTGRSGSGFDYDLRVCRALFAESRNIGWSEVLLEIASETGPDLPPFSRLFEGSVVRIAVLEESQAGRDRYNIRGTPVVMLADGTRLHLAIAVPVLQARTIVKVRPLPCCGDACLDATRSTHLSGQRKQAGALQQRIRKDNERK